MSDVLTQYHQYADGILTQLKPENRTKLAREIAKKIREHNRKRIVAQVDPDGASFIPRKKQRLRAKKGHIRRKMFSKIRTTKYLKINANANSASVSFIDAVSRIAKAHHFGLRDRVNDHVDTIYPKRQLLGINNADLMMVEQLTLSHLARNL
ncbi:phage virion morphogenesis protein [Utexia brackfieldae]|uniref:phage virion morphogenesis protein n=1 Tax=Utexia brackfieldae TaxID=3074108 RepID=UPI00370D0000